MKLRRPGAIAIAALILVPFLFGTEPLPAPYHQYVVQGEIIRQGGGPRQNFVVSLAGKFGRMIVDSTVELRGGFIHPSSAIPQTVTDTSGRFTLDVRTEMQADSLAILVSVVDRPTFVSAMFPLPARREEITRESQSRSGGCHGCETDSVNPTDTYIVGYRYEIRDRSVVIPL